MTQRITEYAQMLLDMAVPREAISQAEGLLEEVPELFSGLEEDQLSLEKKHGIIGKVFPVEIRDFLKLLCDNGDVDQIHEIIATYKKRIAKDDGVVLATIRYVEPPTEEQLEKIRRFLLKELRRSKIEIQQIHDPKLLFGFVITADNLEFNWSGKERLRQMQSQITENLYKKSEGRELGAPGLHSTQEIISIIKGEIENFDSQFNNQEIGAVKWVGDGIALINGIDHAMYGEIVIFDNGVRGMVQEIRREEIGCILFGNDSGIREGTRVSRTGKRAGIPVGEEYLGRIVDPLGSPVDGKGEIASAGYRPVENPAPGIMDRKSVTVPLETGILSLDSMVPIGRGQRELIIGDRQTGKTSIAVDTILNQKGKDVICIYAAIGQKASTVAKVVSTLQQGGAMDYTAILLATASDPASLQYIAPYSATALAEYFMYQGRDVLIVYDDLSKHAVAYRALSLLLERSPGREAYPGDVFYLHSRLLERASRLTDEKGGGSITALPIIETQAGDVSAYIPTNVISITDGQIFLESDLFFAGMRPAVNVGLSVSRVGGAAQTKAMKKAAGSLRIDLAQYREMEVFSQFSSDLDESTRQQLQYGAGLMEVLKQPLSHPLSLHQQVISLCVAVGRQLADIKLEEIKDCQGKLLKWFEEEHPEICREIDETKLLSDKIQSRILELAKEFKSRYGYG